MEQVLYYNGTIITMENREAPYAEAVLTENGRIKDRGSFPRLREAAGKPVILVTHDEEDVAGLDAAPVRL